MITKEEVIAASKLVGEVKALTIKWANENVRSYHTWNAYIGEDEVVVCAAGPFNEYELKPYDQYFDLDYVVKQINDQNE